MLIRILFPSLFNGLWLIRDAFSKCLLSQHGQNFDVNNELFIIQMFDANHISHQFIVMSSLPFLTLTVFCLFV